MRPPVPPHVETLTPYVPGKPIEETEREYGVTNVLKLASNENPLGPSPKAMKALAEWLPKMHLYPDGASFYLRRRLAGFLGVSEAEVVLGSGSNELIELLIRTFMHEDDEALVCQGSFLMYKVALHAHGKRYVEAPMRDRHYDLEAMADRVGPRTRLVFAANPDNPTGTWFGRASFEPFVERVFKANPDTLLVMDEAYFEYVTDPACPNSLVYRRDYPNLVTLRTFSKIYGLAGVRLGYGVLRSDLAAYLDRTRMPFNVTAAAQVAGLAALDDVEHVEKTRALNAAEVPFVTAALQRLGLDVLPSQANFVLVDLKRPSGPVNVELLKRGVIVRPVPAYGFPTSVRITLGTRAENERMIAALTEVIRG